MIQRIQTVFLALAAMSGLGVLAFPFATVPDPVAASALFSDKNYTVGDNIGLIVLFVAGGALALASIFLYQNRPLQMKIGRFSIISFVLALVLAVILFWQDLGSLGAATPSDGFSAYLPILAIILTVLGVRYIKKDEEKVRSSMDRLR